MLDKIAARAQRASGYTELRWHGNYSVQMSMRKGTLMANTRSQSRGLSARIHRNAGFGFAGLPGDDDDTITAVLAQAADNARLLRQTAEPGVPPVPSPASVCCGNSRVEQLYQYLREKAQGTQCEAGFHDVVLDSAVAGILAHEAIGHTCEANSVLAGSVAGDCLGEMVASEKITLGDYGGRGPDGSSSFAIHVDDEGTPCQDVTIIEKGVLKNFLHNKETARPTTRKRAKAIRDADVKAPALSHLGCRRWPSRRIGWRSPISAGRLRKLHYATGEGAL